MREINHHLRLIFPLHILENGKCLLLNFNGMNKQTGSFYVSTTLKCQQENLVKSRLFKSRFVNFVLCPKSREIKKYQNEESLFSFGIGLAHVGHRLHQYFICQVCGQTKIKEHSGQTSAL